MVKDTSSTWLVTFRFPVPRLPGRHQVTDEFIHVLDDVDVEQTIRLIEFLMGQCHGSHTVLYLSEHRAMHFVCCVF